MTMSLSSAHSKLCPDCYNEVVPLVASGVIGVVCPLDADETDDQIKFLSEREGHATFVKV